MTLRPPLSRTQTALPNVRSEDETEMSYLMNLIETTAYPLVPACLTILGRHPRDATYLASLYGVGKQGLTELQSGPQSGSTRLEALRGLLDVVETEVGRMMVKDGRRAAREKDAEWGEGGGGRRDGTGGSGSGRSVVLARLGKEKYDGGDGWE